MFDKLDADIAHAMMGINAVKGVELGDGFAVVAQKGTEHRDEIAPTGFLKNSSGGILGGISSGQDIVVSIALKPTSSIRLPGDTVNAAGAATEVVTTGRHDPCVGLRAAPIAEAMLAHRADGPLPAQPCAECRRPVRCPGHRGPGGHAGLVITG